MLALPVASGASGFFPSIVMMILSWFCMTASALMLMEVCLWMPEKNAHVITMTSTILGPVGKIIAWILFLYISYASQVAYAAGGGAQVASFIHKVFGVLITKDMGTTILAVTFSLIIIFGGSVVSRVNSLFFMALIFAYVALVAMGTGEVNTSYLFNQEWKIAWVAIPLLLTAFSFQTMVPSLTPILKSHTGSLRFAIIGGTTIALFVYIIWQFLIVGIVPVYGPHGLIEANIQSVPATEFLRQHVNAKVFVYTAEFFGFFAIITSFLAMGLGLFDFLSDGLHIKKNLKGKAILGFLLIVPTVIFATQFERAFMVALDTSGGYGDTILNGMIPVTMVWIGRYRLGYSNGFRVPGGKPLLIVVFIFFFTSLILEIFMQTGIIPSSYESYEFLKIHNVQEAIQ